MDEYSIILPVCYFPPVSYFSILATGRPVRIETGETYPKQTLRNRCHVAGSQGKLTLVVPASKPFGNHTKTHQVLASGHENWRMKHWRSLEACYAASPYFLYYSDEIKQMLMDSPDRLAQLDMHLLAGLLKICRIQADFTYSEEYTSDTAGAADLRGAFSKKGFPWPSGPARYEQAYADKSGFLEDLSILDLLFNQGPGTAEYLCASSRLIA